MNPEHVRLLNLGVKDWNDWRDANKGTTPDLSGANLDWAQMRGADLRGANLRETRLSGADLSGADLSWANLRGANLSGAVLRGANLRRAILSGANFSHSIWLGVAVGDVDLRDVSGLEAVRHAGPSTVGIDTIIRSEGKIPRAFLLGAGVPESFVDYIPSLIAGLSPIQFYSCFISYSSANEDFARRLYADLQATNVRCWFAPEDLKTGDRFRQRIEDAIRIYDKLLVVLSEKSVESDWVETEVEGALERERRDPDRRDVLFPIRLDGAVMTTEQAWAGDLRRKRHIGDFTRWKEHDAYKAAFDRLLQDLKASAEPGPVR